MLKLSIQVTGKTWDALVFALEAITVSVTEQYEQEQASNETGSYTFEVTGYDESDEEETEDA